MARAESRRSESDGGRVAGLIEAAVHSISEAIRLSEDGVGVERGTLDPDSIAPGGILTRRELYDMATARATLSGIGGSVLLRAQGANNG